MQKIKVFVFSANSLNAPFYNQSTQCSASPPAPALLSLGSGVTLDDTQPVRSCGPSLYT